MEDGFGHAFVAPAEDGDASAAAVELSGEHFYYGGFAGAADGEVTDTDGQASERRGAKDAFAIEPQTQLDEGEVDEGKRTQDNAKQAGSVSVAAVEDNINGEGFQAFEPASHGDWLRTLTPELSTFVMRTRAFCRFEAVRMASAMGCGFVSVAQAIVEPEPLSQPPRAPAARAARMTSSK